MLNIYEFNIKRVIRKYTPYYLQCKWHIYNSVYQCSRRHRWWIGLELKTWVNTHMYAWCIWRQIHQRGQRSPPYTGRHWRMCNNPGLWRMCCTLLNPCNNRCRRFRRQWVEYFSINHLSRNRSTSADRSWCQKLFWVTPRKQDVGGSIRRRCTARCNLPWCQHRRCRASRNSTSRCSNTLPDSAFFSSQNCRQAC